MIFTFINYNTLISICQSSAIYSLIFLRFCFIYFKIITRWIHIYNCYAVLINSFLKHFNNSGRYVVMSCCAFNLYFPMTSDVDHLLMCLFAICMSSSMQYLSCLLHISSWIFFSIFSLIQVLVNAFLSSP